tara:strand:+ start:430 stop:618 length:189 start_codon:yes stop_codon:yes gene_type:complete
MTDDIKIVTGKQVEIDLHCFHLINEVNLLTELCKHDYELIEPWAEDITKALVALLDQLGEVQ